MRSVASARKQRQWGVLAAAALLAAPVGALQLAYAQPGSAPTPAPALAPVMAAAQQTSVAAPATFFSVVPVQGEMRSPYGPRPDPFTGEQAFHRGMDWSAPTGTSVIAPGPGRVTFAGMHGQHGYGIVVQIDHGGGVTTSFAHLDSVAVSEGQSVGAAQMIGQVGSTGRSTEPHLHMEVRRNGELVDPASVLPSAN
jgi:murein DD-endopeptidase MepM/ murein hydrolase activator NlpD